MRPFASNIETEHWLRLNCSPCKTKCIHKSDIEGGRVTLETAEFIGYYRNGNRHVKFNIICYNKDFYVPEIRVVKREKQLTLF